MLPSPDGTTKNLTVAASMSRLPLLVRVVVVTSVVEAVDFPVRVDSLVVVTVVVDTAVKVVIPAMVDTPVRVDTLVRLKHAPISFPTT
jgi:hypothetical protein